jgi:beta-lactamase regulating signal transducer with metallopeptidase domain
MTDWLVHTLVWTGALIALVLFLRRPVARHFGAPAAYALWLLPFLRLLIPPVELPAWLAPTPDVTGTPAGETMVHSLIITGDPVMLPAEVSAPPAIDWLAVLVAVWLIGAAAFLIRRFALYFRMRSEMLADAVPVGSAGRVRLVETPAAPSPVAFGVIDRVVALPPGFMAWHDRTARDLALAHELAHHRGNDLLANFAAQPLFALHWFNPLGWYGWNAMRRDQEAACDARVVARCASELRGTYATVIAGFAAGPNVALAAPMACPVLGDKSIIHRLRSLTMNDITPRRRMAGRVLLASGILALPLTASISYAESLQDPPSAPLPPEAPAAPDVPWSPEAPEAPEPPEFVEEIDLPPTADGEPRRKVVIVRREAGAPAADGEERKVERRTHVIRHDGKEMTEEERARFRAEMREKMAGLRAELDAAHEARRVAMVEMRKGFEHVTGYDENCDADRPSAVSEMRDGRTVTVLCRKRIQADALSGIKEARASIAADADMDPSIKAQVLQALDQQIAQWGKHN